MSENAYMQADRDPHEVLDVPRDADRQQIIRAFHRKARRGGHPDAGGDARTFDEMVRARDALLGQARLGASETHRPAPQAGAVPDSKPQPTYAPPRPSPPEDGPPRETNKLAIVTVVLAALGPLLWPVAILTGHLALWRIKRTGQGGGTLVPVVLLFLYVLTIPVLGRILSIILIP